jgi:AcrR family transcriptional regulator
MPPQTPKRLGRPPRHNRDEMLEIALAMVRRAGIRSFSLRGLARELGGAATSIYNYFDDKDALLHGVAALALERVELDLPAQGSWTERIETWMRKLRSELLAFPELVELISLEGHHPGELARIARVLEELSLLLEEQGLGRAEAALAAQSLTWTVIGFFIMESGARRSSLGELSDYQRAVGDRHIASDDGAPQESILPYLAASSFDPLFDSTLWRTIAGLEAQVRAAKT